MNVLNFTLDLENQLDKLDVSLAWMKHIVEFIEQWQDESDSITISTSGTTGVPKVYTVKKEWMRFSARNTLSFFNLKPEDKVLLALSAEFIGGKMMLVRAIEGGLKLWLCPPNDLSILNQDMHFNFCPLVPLQAEKYIHQLHKIERILLGGGPVSKHLEKRLIDLPSQFYQSFAMTETLSHFAIRNISKKESEFQVFSNIQIGVNENNCLWLKATQLGQPFLQTNDVIELLPDQRFIWKGRFDFIINSGGIKYNPEILEEGCGFLLKLNIPFFISSQQDSKFGERIVLVIEESSFKIHDAFTIRRQDFNLVTYAIPKKWILVKRIPRTEVSNKIKRLAREELFHADNVLHEEWIH
ncbi:MAG: AMP-binding protein [Flavobacteriales bacterium]